MIKKVSPSELKSMLRNGKVEFVYEKKDGSIRTAVGTNNPDFMTHIPTGGFNPAKAAGYTPYFDLRKNGFRCFDESRIVGVVEK